MPKSTLAIILFVLLSQLLTINSGWLTNTLLPDHRSQGSSSESITTSGKHTWPEWAIADFERRKENPSVVFLGSSLMFVPLNAADSNLCHCIFSGALHHTSVLFSSLTNKIANFSFALPGEMPSDAYLITKTLLSSKNYPELIIYGVGPRDFLDNYLTSPSITDTYHCLHMQLEQIAGPKALIPFIGADYQQRLNYWLGCLLPVYQYREQIVTSIEQQLVRLVSKLDFTQNTANTVERSELLSKNKLQELLAVDDPQKVEAKDFLFKPTYNAQPNLNRFKNNLDEYRLRYRHTDWDIFSSQAKFFLDFLKLAIKDNRKVLIIAMPVTTANRSLIPNHVFAAYKEQLRVSSLQYGADFLDLDKSFNDSDFNDSVHLNARASGKFVRLIADHLKQHALI